MIATFGVLQVFFSMLWFFLFIVWIMLLFRVYADIFRSDDMGGVAKAIWIIVCIVFWVLGPMVYIIARGGKMAERELKAAQDQEAAVKQYIQQAAAPTSVADELHRLSELKDKGVISDAEFQSLKAKALA
jgi:predicted membrane protein